MLLLSSLACLKDYVPRAGKIKCAWGSKKYTAVCHDWRYIRTWLAQFVNLLPRWGAAGSVPAPTRFSEAHTAPDIAGIMEQAKCGGGRVRENVCRRIFTENRRRSRASFSDMLEKYDRHSTTSFKIYAQRSACMSRWFGLLFSNFRIETFRQNIQNYLVWSLSINIFSYEREKK